MGAIHGEGDLGVIGVADPVVAGDPDDLIVEHRHEGEAVDVVDLDEVMQPLVRKRGHIGEEAEVHAPSRKAPVEGSEQRRILGPDRTDRHRAPSRKSPLVSSSVG